MLHIYKRLPKTNCGRCGEATCLAFAMKVHKSLAQIPECPFVEEDTSEAGVDRRPEEVSSYEQVGDRLEREAVQVDFRNAAEAVGGRYVSEGGTESLFIKMLNTVYELRRDGLYAEGSRCRDPWTKITICDYVRRMGKRPLTGELITLGHFPHTASHVKAFQSNAEKKIAGSFGNDPEVLRRRSAALGGVSIEGKLKADFACSCDLLPHVQVYLSFWQADEEFGADCKLLFDSSAEAYIDIEYLAYLLERFTEELTGGT